MDGLSYACEEAYWLVCGEEGESKMQRHELVIYFLCFCGLLGYMGLQTYLVVEAYRHPALGQAVNTIATSNLPGLAMCTPPLNLTSAAEHLSRWRGLECVFSPNGDSSALLPCSTSIFTLVLRTESIVPASQSSSKHTHSGPGHDSVMLSRECALFNVANGTAFENATAFTLAAGLGFMSITVNPPGGTALLSLPLTGQFVDPGQVPTSFEPQFGLSAGQRALALVSVSQMQSLHGSPQASFVLGSISSQPQSSKMEQELSLTVIMSSFYVPLLYEYVAYSWLDLLSTLGAAMGLAKMAMLLLTWAYTCLCCKRNKQHGSADEHEDKPAAVGHGSYSTAASEHDSLLGASTHAKPVSMRGSLN